MQLQYIKNFYTTQAQLTEFLEHYCNDADLRTRLYATAVKHIEYIDSRKQEREDLAAQKFNLQQARYNALVDERIEPYKHTLVEGAIFMLAHPFRIRKSSRCFGYNYIKVKRIDGVLCAVNHEDLFLFKFSAKRKRAFLYYISGTVTEINYDSKTDTREYVKHPMLLTVAEYNNIHIDYKREKRIKWIPCSQDEYSELCIVSEYLYIP